MGHHQQPGTFYPVVFFFHEVYKVVSTLMTTLMKGKEKLDHLTKAPKRQALEFKG